ncbi:RSF1-like protein [Mya arenaria]|uniref:RSF1-like protein n=1 Tax=Mya arenaria TaxID=6604 RepID=A0ABY7G3A5_MYAAR|nr:RSF1-like protein [Mya arenaria]
MQKSDSYELDPNFAVVCSFLERFGHHFGEEHRNVATDDLKAFLEDENVGQENVFIKLHRRLLRGIGNTVKAERFAKDLMKFAEDFPERDDMLIQSAGYNYGKIPVAAKLRIFKNLLEDQFEFNDRFNQRVNEDLESSGDIRHTPLGHDKLGRAYWCLLDKTGRLLLYRSLRNEITQEETWALVCSDVSEFGGFIDLLEDGSTLEKNDDPSIDGSTSIPLHTPIKVSASDLTAANSADCAQALFFNSPRFFKPPKLRSKQHIHQEEKKYDMPHCSVKLERLDKKTLRKYCRKSKGAWKQSGKEQEQDKLVESEGVKTNAAGDASDGMVNNGGVKPLDEVICDMGGASNGIVKGGIDASGDVISDVVVKGGESASKETIAYESICARDHLKATDKVVGDDVEEIKDLTDNAEENNSATISDISTSKSVESKVVSNADDLKINCAGDASSLDELQSLQGSVGISDDRNENVTSPKNNKCSSKAINQDIEKTKSKAEKDDIEAEGEEKVIDETLKELMELEEIISQSSPMSPMSDIRKGNMIAMSRPFDNTKDKPDNVVLANEVQNLLDTPEDASGKDTLKVDKDRDSHIFLTERETKNGALGPGEDKLEEERSENIQTQDNMKSYISKQGETCNQSIDGIEEPTENIEMEDIVNNQSNTCDNADRDCPGDESRSELEKGADLLKNSSGQKHTMEADKSESTVEADDKINAVADEKNNDLLKKVEEGSKLSKTAKKEEDDKVYNQKCCESITKDIKTKMEVAISPSQTIKTENVHCKLEKKPIIADLNIRNKQISDLKNMYLQKLEVINVKNIKENDVKCEKPTFANNGKVKPDDSKEKIGITSIYTKDEIGDEIMLDDGEIVKIERVSSDTESEEETKTVKHRDVTDMNEMKNLYMQSDNAETPVEVKGVLKFVNHRPGATFFIRTNTPKKKSFVKKHARDKKESQKPKPKKSNKKGKKQKGKGGTPSTSESDSEFEKMLESDSEKSENDNDDDVDEDRYMKLSRRVRGAKGNRNDSPVSVECDRDGKNRASPETSGSEAEENLDDGEPIVLGRNARRAAAMNRVNYAEKDVNSADDDEEEEEEEEEDIDDTDLCKVCASAAMPHTILLCDGCDSAYHMTCLSPPLSLVPLEDWYCPGRATRRKTVNYSERQYDDIVKKAVKDFNNEDASKDRKRKSKEESNSDTDRHTSKDGSSSDTEEEESGQLRQNRDRLVLKLKKHVKQNKRKSNEPQGEKKATRRSESKGKKRRKLTGLSDHESSSESDFKCSDGESESDDSGKNDGSENAEQVGEIYYTSSGRRTKNVSYT